MKFNEIISESLRDKIRNKKSKILPDNLKGKNKNFDKSEKIDITIIKKLNKFLKNKSFNNLEEIKQELRKNNITDENNQFDNIIEKSKNNYGIGRINLLINNKISNKNLIITKEESYIQ